MMTPKERVAAIVEKLFIDQEFSSPDEVEEMLLRNFRAAINDKLEEAAVELDKLSQGTYTTAQTPASLVRAMKVK